MRNTATIEQSGHWHVSENGASMVVVSGDFAVGFIARDQDGRVLDRPTYERAMYVVLHKPSADFRARHCDLISAA